jgi:rubrerythrin
MKGKGRLNADDLKVLAMIEAAGELFYKAVAEQVPIAQAKQLLLRNGQEERGHGHRMVKAIRVMTGEEYSLPSDDLNPFAIGTLAAIKSINVNDAFLGQLVQGELDGDRQYQAWAAAEPNEEIAKLYRQTGREEIAHGTRLDEVRQLLSGHGR